MVGVRATVVLAVLSLIAAAARASDFTVVEGVRVEGPPCPIAPVSVPAFVDSLRVELAGRPRASRTTLVTLSIDPCDAGTKRVHVRVTSDPVGPAAERDVGLEDIAPEARTRALALAVAELVRGAEGPAPRSAAAVVVAAVPPPPHAAPPSTGVAADAVLALFPNRDTALWGGRLSVSLDGAHLAGALFAEAAVGARAYDVGSVALQSFGGGVVVGPRWLTHRLTLAPALVGALGWARIQGHANLPDVAAGAGSGLTAALRGRLALSTIFVRVLSVRVFAEGGVVVRGFDAVVDGARAEGVSGATFVVGAGLSL